MRDALPALRVLGQDLAATLLFTLFAAVTHDVRLAVAVGLAVGVGQLAFDLHRRRSIEPLQWTSLALVVMAGAATLLTHDARFVMLKPTLIYLVIGATMLKRGWMDRYLPPAARALLPDWTVGFGYAWAGLMGATALLNLVLVATVSLPVWGAVMATAPLAGKFALFAVQLAVMKTVGRRRYRADPVSGAAAIAAAAA